MKNARSLLAQLRCRLTQDRLSDAEFTIALAEVLTSLTDTLSGADALILSQEVRELEQAWRESIKRPVN